MNECLLCKQEFIPEISFLQIFSWSKYREPKICFRCLHQFERLSEIRCKYCSKNMNVAGTCHDCLDWQQIYGQNLLYNYSVYRYNDYFHDLMVNYKRYDDYVLYEVLQEICYKELLKIEADLYVPIPTSPEHQQKRQFDTISAIFSGLVPLTPLLKKKSGCEAQGEKNKYERLASSQSFYIDKEKIKKSFNGKSILLLDDIYTTGRTLYHARDQLLQFLPDSEIKSFSICR